MLLVKGLLEGVLGEHSGKVMEGKWAHEAEEVGISDAQGQAHRMGDSGTALHGRQTRALWGPRRSRSTKTGDRCPTESLCRGETAV